VCSNPGYSAEKKCRHDSGNVFVSRDDGGVAMAMGASTTPRRRRDDDDGAMEADSNWTTDDPSPAPWKCAADRGGPEYIRHPILGPIDSYRST